jgi:hypothetical protein
VVKTCKPKQRGVGQNMQAETSRRGQDITEQRERDLALAENQAAAKARGKKLAENKVEAERALPGAIATAEQTLTLDRRNDWRC